MIEILLMKDKFVSNSPIIRYSLIDADTPTSNITALF